MNRGCLFCGIVAGTVPSVMVAQDDTICAFMDIDPGSDGHLLIVPRRHSTDLFDIPADDLSATTLAAQQIAKVAVTEFHLHLIPRYADKTKDRLTMPFEPGMPADADTITALGHRLAAALAKGAAPRNLTPALTLSCTVNRLLTGEPFFTGADFTASTRARAHRGWSARIGQRTQDGVGMIGVGASRWLGRF